MVTTSTKRLNPVAKQTGEDYTDDVDWNTLIDDVNTIVAIKKNSGSTVGTRNTLNFIEGTNITLTVADNSGSGRVDITIAASGGAGGEANTASNVGTGGVGVFKQKTGVNLEFKKINAGSNKITITDDTGNSEVDVDVAEANLTHNNIGGNLSVSKGGTNLTSYTSGDILYATGATTLAKLAIGSTNQVLTVSGALPAWVTGGGGAGDTTAQIPSAQSVSAYNTAIANAGTNGKVRGISTGGSGSNLTINSPLRISDTSSNDGVEVDFQGVNIIRGTSFSGTALLMIDKSSGSTTTKITIRNASFDLNNGAGGSECHGISNIDDFVVSQNYKLKFTLIHDIVFNNNANGKHYIFLRQVENLLEINHCELDQLKSSSGSKSYACYLECDGHAGGNVAISFCKISLYGESTTTHNNSNSGKCIYIVANQTDTSLPGSFNRCLVIGCHLFCNNSHIGAWGVHIDLKDAGGTTNNRTHIIAFNGIEDFKFEVEISRSVSGSGADGCLIIGNGLENKNDGSPGEYESGNALVVIGLGVTCNISNNYLMWQGATSGGSGQVWTTIKYDSSSTDSHLHNNEFVKKAGNADITWTKVGGSSPSNLTDKAVHNVGFKTEGTYISADQDATVNGDKSTAVTHDLDITPALQDIMVGFADGSTAVAAGSAWRCAQLRVVSANSTTITWRAHQTAAGAAGEKFKTVIHVRRNF